MATYHIIINKKVNRNFIKKEIVCATGQGQPRPFSFKIQKGAVEIEYEMSKVKSLDYTIEKSVVFREALTKAYLYHALLLNSALMINQITLLIEGEEYTLNKENNVNFPFVFSLLTEDDLHLNNAFEVLPDYIVVNSIKFNQKELRFVSLASYLSAKSKTYQIERFNSLWTSMNALYNYVALCYENRIVDDCTGITRSDIPSNLRMYGKDANGISAMMYHLKNNCRKPSRNDESDTKANNTEAFQQLASLFQRLSDDEISELYTLCLSDLRATGIVHSLPQKYAALDTVSRLYGFPSYLFVILQYAYSLRCELLYGNKATPIFCSYNDRSIGELKVVNHFLDSYLCNEIPLLFTTNYYDAMHNDVAALMNIIAANNNNPTPYTTFIRNNR